MPIELKKLRGKWRVVESSGRLVRNSAGTPVDGGGHRTRVGALKQAEAINTPKSRRR